MLSIICNYFLLGVAVSASLIIIIIIKAEAQVSGDPGAPPQSPQGTAAVKASPGSGAHRPGSRVAAGTGTDAFRQQAAGHLPPPSEAQRARRARRWPGEGTHAPHSPSSLAGPRPRRAGLQADAKFKPRRRWEEAAPGIARGARPRSTMGGSAAPCASAPGLQRLRRARGAGLQGPESGAAARRVQGARRPRLPRGAAPEGQCPRALATR